MEESKRELKPEEMRDVSGGSDPQDRRYSRKPKFLCSECGFGAANHDLLIDHIRDVHHRSPKPSELMPANP